jgi:tRNA (uracil-5-)-methyltransferase
MNSSKGLSNDNEILCNHDVLEIYCGNANHTCAISKFSNRVVAVEINIALCDAANENLYLNDISNVQIILADSMKFTRNILRNKKFTYFNKDTLENIEYNFKTILVDPPRCGLDSYTRELIVNYNNIIYISCCPASLHRDLDFICCTHKIVKVAVFDQFAYTSHIETGVYLIKI